MSSLSMTDKCWRQKLFCFLSSLSTSAELGESCLSSCGRIGLHRNPLNYRIMGCGAKNLEKWLCALCALQMKIAESSVSKALGNMMQFLSVLACCDPRSAGWGLESLWIQEDLLLVGGVWRCIGWDVSAAHYNTSEHANTSLCIPEVWLPTWRKHWILGVLLQRWQK